MQRLTTSLATDIRAPFGDGLLTNTEISLTMARAWFAENPGMDCLSFVAFNETNPIRLGPLRLLVVSAQDLDCIDVLTSSKQASATVKGNLGRWVTAFLQKHQIRRAFSTGRCSRLSAT